MVSVVIPVYNEEHSVEAIIRKVINIGGVGEIIVVDDGSIDSTPKILSRLKDELAICVLSHKRNEGKGYAVRTALKQAKGDIILIQDADLEYDPEDYSILLKPLFDGRASVVFGSRFLGPHQAILFWHRLGNWLITTLVNLCFNASLTDVETGYKAFRREAVEGITLRARGFEVEVELACKILRKGCPIFEVPISYYGRTYAEGKKITWKDGFVALAWILRCRLNPSF